MFNMHSMLALQLTVVLFVSCNSLSIGVGENKTEVRKREANTGEFYPDWVPFKNKHGEELGEFVQVKKRKPTKRLALPTNFILRAVAEPDGDDYYDKGQGESDGAEYFEKKDWSDTSRPAEAVDHNTKVNHTDLSDIDGVVNIITKPNPITEVLKKQSKQVSSKENESNEKEKNTNYSKENCKDCKDEKKSHEYEDESDYDEESAEKSKPDTVTEDQSESEAKKAKILNSVDLLKERHAEEQRAISEKVKEDEIYKEELERDQIQSEEFDKYGNIASKRVPNISHKATDYDDYEDKPSLQDKYKINPLPPTTTTTTTEATRRPTRRKSTKAKTEKSIETGKLSVFKNPRAYMIYDNDESEETTTTKKTTTRPSRKLEPVTRYSSRYVSPSTLEEDSGRISLVPEDNESKGEPTLFFPKKRKNKRRRKNKASPVIDSYVAESVPDKAAKDLLTGSEKIVEDSTGLEKQSLKELPPSAEESGPSGGSSAPSAQESAPSAEDSAPSAASAPSAVDTVPAPSDKKEAKKEDYHHENGVDREHHSEHEEAHEEHGKKAYEGVHKDTKTEKGHHDKEDHLGKYHDHGGIDEHHHDEKNHYGAHHHEEHGKKHAKYEESGKHSKGHSTKGSHDIHKKEEYEKNVEFFEEEGDSAEEEKHGGHTEEKEHKSGGHFKKGDLKGGYHGHSKGDAGHFKKGGHGHVHKGHRGSAGHDSHRKHGGDMSHQDGKESGKKWVYHHGHPAKTANLVAIDRRIDQYHHGPQYYG